LLLLIATSSLLLLQLHLLSLLAALAPLKVTTVSTANSFCQCPGVTCYCWLPSPPVDCSFFVLWLLKPHALLAPKPRLFLQRLLPQFIVAFMTFCSLLQNTLLHWYHCQNPPHHQLIIDCVASLTKKDWFVVTISVTAQCAGAGASPFFVVAVAITTHCTGMPSPKSLPFLQPSDDCCFCCLLHKYCVVTVSCRAPFLKPTLSLQTSLPPNDNRMIVAL